MGSSQSLAQPQVVFHSNALLQMSSSDPRAALLEAIDSLRALQVGGTYRVDLPQIVVVGSPSAGKSSVLEAIVGVRFLGEGEYLSTRHPTELVFRRAEEARIEVTVLVATKQEHDGEYHDASGPRRPFRKVTADKNALPGIIREARALLGVADGAAAAGKCSEHVLRLEIAHPDVHPLTLVDLPGIAHGPAADQDPEQNQQTVDQVVERYAKPPNNIVLAVVAADSQSDAAGVLEIARRHDPSGERTIGVITKPDLAGPPGSLNERECLDLVRGRNSACRLPLGWHVLRNAPGDDRSGKAAADRDADEERFFGSGAWASLRPASRGVASLRTRLRDLLLARTKAQLPGLIRDVEEGLRHREAALGRLGEARPGPDEMKSSLIAVAEHFQRLARDAVEGRYDDAFFGGLYQDSTKLRAVLRNLNRAFIAVMSTKGARYAIERGEVVFDDDLDLRADGQNVPEYLQPFVDAYAVSDPEPVREPDLKSRLQLLASANRGREFPGLPGDEFVRQLFVTQAGKWQEIAQFHLDQVLKFGEAFVGHALDHVTAARRRNAKILPMLLDDFVYPFFDRKKEELRAKLHEILRPYQRGYALPLEKEFHTRVSRRTAKRIAPQLSGYLGETDARGPPASSREGLDGHQIVQAILGSDRMEMVIDMMEVHYKVCENHRVAEGVVPC